MTVLLGLAFAVLTIPLGQMTSNRSLTLDFANFYTAGRILRRGQSHRLYDLRLQQEVERKISPGGPFMAFFHPPFEALLFAAFAGLPYQQAFVLWAAMNLVVLGLIVFLLRFVGYRLGSGDYMAWLMICLFFALSALALGQDTLPLALVFLLAFLALKRRHDFVAGLALGLGLFRFEILLPFAFVFLLRRRWKVMAGLSTMGVGALLASAAVVGWTGILRYVRALVEVANGGGLWLGAKLGASAMPNLRGALYALLENVIPRAFLFPVILVATLFLLGWATWQFKAMNRPEDPAFDLEFSLAVIAALLASYHLFISELTPLIIAGFLILGYEETPRNKVTTGSRRGTALLFLFLGTIAAMAVIHSQDFSVEVIVLLGLMVWLSQEISSLKNEPLL